MKEVRIREASNGYIIEYWSVPKKFGDREEMLELNCTEVHSLFADALMAMGKHFGEND